MATIKAIEGRTIHQIQSGQVIVDLCSVVKELVENSLDAGASSIEVRFKNQGLESIEVHDNGAGITAENYETIALKHYTSKLATYADLTTLHTFGFRGEALSSLCALSDFTITTCTAEDAPKGTKLDFEVSGKLKGTSVVAAQKGTTVTVENLFNNLPVRRRELERNIKREWNRVVTVLGQYACIQTGVKITVTQQAGKGKKTTVFATKGNPTTRENIANVFGAKTLVALVPLDLSLELEPSSGPTQRWSTQDDGDGTKEIRIVGHISKPISGEGRQLPDKQMFFVNSRPCGLPQVAKAFNEVYKSYNNNQSPFIFANIELDTHLYDVNVSPDKRTIMLHEQTSMLEQLKLSLTELFEKQDYAVPISQLSSQKQPAYKQLTINREPPPTPSVRATAPAIREEAEETDEESALGEDQSVDDDGKASGPSDEALEVSEARQDVASRDRGAIDLMNKWHDAKTKDRAIQGDGLGKSRSIERADGPSKEKLTLSKRLPKEGEIDDQASDVADTESEHGSADEMPETSHRLPVPVQDFNARLAEVERGGQEADGYKPPIPKADNDYIPTIASPTRRAAPGTGSIISKHVRPRRMSEETATITIGDHTTISSIGTPRPKKRRLEPPSSNISQHDSTPSFGSRLTQRFAAPGADIEQTDSSMDEGEESVGDEAEGLGEEAEEEVEEQEEEYPEGLEMEHSPEMEDEETVQAPAEEYEEEVSNEGGPEEETSQDFAPMGDSSMLPAGGDQDGDYIDEDDKKALEDAKVQAMIKAAEEVASRPSADNEKRANSLLKNDARRKDATVHLVKNLDTTVDIIARQMHNLNESLSHFEAATSFEESSVSGIDSANAEEKLSLTIHKTDFAKMKIIGQFNLGFILASRTSHVSDSTKEVSDDVFIIDQHASDEKYNFERLQASTTVQSQRLVQPKPLSLTALEEEIVIEHLDALETNGFLLSIDHNAPVGQRCHLVALPLSRETTFSLSDLEELIVLLTETPPGQVPRPSKVRKMFAMRACRSSVMIGRTLTTKQMAKLVGHMGEIDKPWNCPHGRPTMRHLCGLGGWDEEGWREGQGPDGEKDEGTDWKEYVRRKKATN
ncbi:hypothetical protein V495_02743 [Pseudogymnoascus sp. VKM F-4514 (FW-929)]|nr:hypothetical protein V495_02743 [Pseudogymnoascus sp. VKM F-4514 (FW-929)]KFY59392.1 hypothetical protein V497_04304 [Pseudogymnoascus sp. VKM F-4516 (FW-969)]